MVLASQKCGLYMVGTIQQLNKMAAIKNLNGIPNPDRPIPFENRTSCLVLEPPPTVCNNYC